MRLLDMSVAGALVILAVVVVRALGGNRLPRAMFTVLWAVALIRLLTPVRVPSPVSVYAWLPSRIEAAQTEPARAEATEPEAVPGPAVSAGERQREGGAFAPAQAQKETGATAEPAADIPWGTLLWAAGALSCAGVFAEGYLRARRRFREAVPVEDGFVRRWQDDHPLRRQVSVRLSGRVKAPVTYGVLRPVILLSADTDWKDEKTLGYILAHEYGHIRRLDGLKKPVLAAAVCLHWFNPLVWVMLVLADRDMEMACDGYVVRSVGGGCRADYARTLIRLEEVKSGLSPLVSHFSANAMEERIVSIMKCKKLTAWTVIISLFLTLGVTAVFATDPPEPAAEADPGPYDRGEATVLLPLTEEGLESLFSEGDIQWWTAEDFAAWVKEQKPLLEAAVGCRANSATVMGTWTEERAEKVLAAYEDIAGALKAGTGRLSRTVGGSGQAVVAVGFDWPLDVGSEKTIRGYDVEALLWSPEEDWPQGVAAQTYSVELEPGERWVDIGPSQTQVGLFETIHACFRCLAQTGAVDSEQANHILQDWWTVHQGSGMPDRYVIGSGRGTDGAAMAAEPTPAPVPAGSEEALWYEDLKPQYVWDLTGGSGEVREERPAGEADYLLDIRPYGYRTAVNAEYVKGVQSASALVQPGGEVVVGRSQGCYESLVICQGDGQLVTGARALEGDQQIARETLSVKAGEPVTGSVSWTVPGGTEFFVRNEGDGPIRVDGFMYETG